MKSLIANSAAPVLLLVLALSCVDANAVTINFDDLSGNPTVAFPAGYQGLTWNNLYVEDTRNFLATDSYKSGVVSGTNVAFNGFGDPAAIVSSASFDLVSAYFTGAFHDGLSVTVTGSLNGVIQNTTTFTVNSSSPTLVTFNWANINKLDLSSVGGTHGCSCSGDGTQFAMDNLTIDFKPPVNVPEPQTLSLLLLGFVGFQLVRRSMPRSG